MMKFQDCPVGYHRVVTPWVRRNGKKYYPKNKTKFSFCAKDRQTLSATVVR